MIAQPEKDNVALIAEGAEDKKKLAEKIMLKEAFAHLTESDVWKVIANNLNKEYDNNMKVTFTAQSEREIAWAVQRNAGLSYAITLPDKIMKALATEIADLEGRIAEKEDANA